MSDLVGNPEDWFSRVAAQIYMYFFNPYLTNGFSHHYHLGESTFIFRGVKSDF